MSIRNAAAALLILVSFVILVPGLWLPMVTIRASFAGREVFTLTRSILQAINSLYESGNYIVASMILLFSVLIPVGKGLLLIFAYVARSFTVKDRIHRFVARIHKWSMGDVFIVGTYVAVFAAKATDALGAQIESGFYYFASYCIVSLIAIELTRHEAVTTD